MKNIKIKSLKVIVFLLLFLAAVSYANNNPSTTIPKNFYVYKDSLKLTTDMYIGKLKLEHMNSLNYYPYFSGLIEHESCISLTHSRCWSAKAELNTKWPNGKQREQGIGFGQITRAYTEAGAIRLDVLNDLKKRFPSDLSELTWNNIRDKPALQMRAIMLLWIDNYKRLPNHISEFDRMAMSDSAYNGGYGFILKDRKTCGLKAGCDANLWFNNVETINNRGNKILYANRTANEINRHHVRDVLLTRMSKYYTIDWD